MNINMAPLMIVGAVLVTAIIAMFVWRKVVSSHEDDVVHVMEDNATAQNQVAIARKLAVIDRWGKLLTFVTFIYALALAALYLYATWLRGSSTVSM